MITSRVRRVVDSGAAGHDFLQSTIDKIRLDNELENLSGSLSHSDEGVVDILTFCKREDLLDLPGQNLSLFQSQKVILKTFYMGSRGNENVELTDEDWQWLYDKQQNAAISKIKRKLDGVNKGERQNFHFVELNLACGRRSGKTLLASVIAAYEAYKLLTLKDPHKTFGVPSDEEMAIINTANSQEQAKRLFNQIKARIRGGPFFKGRVHNRGDSQTEIRLYTDMDLEKRADKETNIAVSGSVVLVCGHSNPDTLRGYSAPCIIFDELQMYQESTIISGSEFYNALKPSVALFAELGQGEGRLVEISTTGVPSGIFYDVHKMGINDDKRFNGILGFHLATWDINDHFSYNGEYLTLEREKDPQSFNVEYGAGWASVGLIHTYFPEDRVMRSIKSHRAMQSHREYGYEYFMHIDPAAKHDSYTVAIVTREKYIATRGEKRWKIVLVFHKVWKPEPGIGLNIVQLDEEILDIARQFRPRSVTFDQWNSVHSINYLRKQGFYANQIAFGRGPKADYYKNLYDLMDRDELEIYGDELLISEMLNIKYKPTTRGISIFADPKAETKTDDLVDALAGAAWMAIGRRLKDNLPHGGLTFFGHESSRNSMPTWASQLSRPAGASISDRLGRF